MDIMPNGVITVNEGEICWKIEAFFELLKEVNFFVSPFFLLDNELWTIMYTTFKGADCNCINLVSAPIELQKPRGNFIIKIKRADGSTYIKEEADVKNNLRIKISEKEIYDSKDILSKDGSLCILIKQNLARNNQQCTIKVLETHKATLETKNASSQTDWFETVNTLSDDFKKLLGSGRHADVKIQVGEKEFQAHKSVLAARSPVLDSMFSQQMLENINGVVTIEDCDAEIFACFLNFLYSAKLDQVSYCTVSGLYEMADKYDLHELKNECIKRLSFELSVDSVCDVLRLALLHDEKDMMKRAMDFFTENAVEVLASQKWKIFLIDHFEFGNDLILMHVKCLSNMIKAK